jgi:alpha-tubulin suppressor-like RCC1 family protein
VRWQNGRVRCWGQLLGEDGELRASAEPVEVPGLDDAVAIAAGAGHSCAIRRGGTVACWGVNTHGQLGDGSREPSATPVAVRGLELSLVLAAGGTELDGVLVGHSCAVTKSFHVQCWGRNREGQLGIGRADDSSTATVVLGEPDQVDFNPHLSSLTGIALGALHSCALDQRGNVECWGDDEHGQLGLSEEDDFVFGRAQDVGLFD